MTQNHHLTDLFRDACHSGNMDFPRLVNLCSLLCLQSKVYGDIVEFGTHKGKTAVVLASMSKKPMWLYDSFEGLPDKCPLDIGSKFNRGDLRADEWECIKTFHDAGFSCSDMPIIVKGWFKNIIESQLPDFISFAHIDCDFFEPTTEALKLVWWKLTTGGVCVIDDYSWPGLPGVKLAVDDFVKKNGLKLIHPDTLGYPAHQCWFFKP